MNRRGRVEVRLIGEKETRWGCLYFGATAHQSTEVCRGRHRTIVLNPTDRGVEHACALVFSVPRRQIQNPDRFGVTVGSFPPVNDCMILDGQDEEETIGLSTIWVLLSYDLF